MQENTGVDINDQQDVAVLAFTSASICDLAAIDLLSKHIKKYIADKNPRKMVIDFTKVKFFTSQTLGLLLDIWRKLKANNGEVVISGINPQLHRVFRITNLDKIFRFFPDQDSAVKALT